MTALDVDGLRAAAEAATTPMTCGGHRSMGSLMRCQECLTRANGASDLATAATPAKVLGLLDRLQAAEAAVERLAAVTDGEKIRCPVCTRWLRLRRGKVPPHYSPDRAEYPNSCPGTSAQPKTRTTSALDGPWDAATGRVASGYTDVLRVPEKPPGWHEAEALCRGCAFCDSDHGGRRDGEGLG